MVYIDLKPGDEKRLFAFYSNLGSTVTATFRPFREVSVAVMKNHLSEVDNGHHISIGIEHSANIVGHGFLMDIDKKHPVFGIGIMEPYQGEGRGRRLMNAVWEKAETLGVGHMTLTVVKNNTRAISLYKDFGFRAVGDHTFEKKNDSYVMWYNGEKR